MTLQDYLQSVEAVPVPNHALGDCYRRIAWADSDAQRLYRMLDAFIRTNPYPTRVEADGERWKVVIYSHVDPETQAKVFAEASRLLGAWLDHIRATLNYLTYQLALLAISEDPSLQGKLLPESVEFPIFNQRSGKAGFKRKNRVKHLPDKYRDLLESVQPYDGRHHDLWVLHELARKYRHRLIHPMPVLPATEHHGIEVPDITDIKIEYDGPLKDGDVLFTFAHPDGNVNPHAALRIGVGDPICGNRDCMDVINGIGREMLEAFNAVAPVFGANTLELPPRVQPTHPSHGPLA